MEEITISCNFSFMMGGDYLCKISSKLENNVSTICHLSFSDFEGKYNEEKKFKVEGNNNFRNLVETIIFNNREDSTLYLPFEGMKQSFETNVGRWETNFLIFCLGGNEETRECYARPFLDLSDEELKSIFNIDDVFKFIELYEEILGYSHYVDFNLSSFDRYKYGESLIECEVPDGKLNFYNLVASKNIPNSEIEKGDFLADIIKI